MRQVELPQVFQQFAPLVQYVQQRSQTEFSSTCPSCGGTVHLDGSWPDRCRWFNDSHPRAWCRVCGKMFYPDQFPGYVPPSPEQLYQWTQERIAEEEARKRSAERALEHLRSAKVWLQYYEQIDMTATKYYQQRGIPKAWVDHFRFGWNPEFRFAHDNTLFVRPSATIPFFGTDGEIQQIKHRIVWEDSAPDELKGDKYRPEIKGVGSPLYLCDPKASLADEVILVEGEFKSAVVKLTLDSVHDTVVGMPGINPHKDRLDILKDAERILLVTDPGTRKQTWELCKTLGPKRCRVVIPTRGKVDDLILESHMTGNELRGLFRQAVPAA